MEKEELEDIKREREFLFFLWGVYFYLTFFDFCCLGEVGEADGAKERCGAPESREERFLGGLLLLQRTIGTKSRPGGEDLSDPILH